VLLLLLLLRFSVCVCLWGERGGEAVTPRVNPLQNRLLLLVLLLLLFSVCVCVCVCVCVYIYT